MLSGAVKQTMVESNNPDSSSFVSTTLRVTKILFTPVALVFLAYFVWLAREELVTTFSAATLGYLVLAVFAWFVFNCTAPLLAVIVLQDLDVRLGFRQALSIHTKRLPARYVPGGVWHTVGRIFDYRDLGVQPRHLTVFVIIENGLAATLTLAVGGGVLFFSRTHDPLIWLAGVSSVVAVVALPLMFFFINRRVLPGPESLSKRAFWQALCSMGAMWLLATAAFLLYLQSFPMLEIHQSQVEIGGAYLFSWGVGFLSVFAPQGIGVFEVLSSKLLQSAIGFVALAAVISGFRVVVLVADIVTWIGLRVLDATFNRDV